MDGIAIGWAAGAAGAAAGAATVTEAGSGRITRVVEQATEPKRAIHITGIADNFTTESLSFMG
jgi:hypothetical protein